ncbi:MAG: MFS transporter [Pseudomonadota bacterium]
MALTTGQKAGWGLCDMGVVTFVIIKQLLVLSFLTTVMGVPVVLAGWLTSCILLFDIFTDPMVGSASDKTQSKWGRRAPWMFWGAVVMALGVVGMFSVPEDLNEIEVIGWVGFGFAIATIGFTMVTVPYSAMAGEITEDPKERSQMTAWRMSFASLGILAGGAVLPAIANKMGYMTGALIIVPLLIIPVWLSIFFTRKVPSSFRPTQLNIAEMARTVFSNWPFLVLVVTYGLMTVAVAMLTAGLPFAAIYLFLDNGASPLSAAVNALSMISFLLACFVFGALFSQPFWAILSNRIGKLAAVVTCLAVYILLLLLLPQMIPIDNVTLIALVFLCFGFANGGYQQIPWAMYPDLIDITRRATGQRIEGAFTAVWLLGQKIANAISPTIVATIIGIYGYRSARGQVVEQTPEAINALVASMTYIPSAIFAVSVVSLIALYLPLLRMARQESADPSA